MYGVYSYKVGQFQRKLLMEIPVAMACRWLSELEILGSVPSEQGSLTRSFGVTVKRQVLENHSLLIPVMQESI